MDLIGVSEFKSDLSVPSILLGVPSIAEPADLLFAAVCAPQHHPNTPWPEPAGWVREIQTVHLGVFTRIASGTESAVTFKANPTLGKASSPAGLLLAFRNQVNDRPIAKAGWPICQRGGDALCAGKWKGNDDRDGRRLSPCRAAGCSQWPAPPIARSVPGDVVVVWAGHDIAEPLTIPTSVGSLAHVQNSRQTLRVTFGAFPAGPVAPVAVPRATPWDHAIAASFAF